MKQQTKIALFFILINTGIFAQKIDTDSLLVKTNYEINTTKNYPKAIKIASLGIKLAPNYLDFHLALGRTYIITKQVDSARYYLNYVIDKDPKYKEAFLYLTKLEIGENNSENAIITVNKAIIIYPEDKDFELLKLQAIYSQNDYEKSIEYLESLVGKYPEDSKIKQQLVELKTKTNSNRVGITYNNTSFNRNAVGPWHLIGFQYIRERKLISFIAQINYAERYSFQYKNSGIQYEFETYFKNNKKSYSYADIAYSYDQNVFPKLRLAYSYFYSFNKGWEADAGIRYSKTTNFNFHAGVFGVGKYVGAYWLNLKSYFQSFENKTYSAFTATARYYLDTKYDYLTAFAGYGTSPDERITLGQFDQRLTFNSYRVGAGYYKLFGTHYATGLQASYNRQEYKLNTFQNEYNLFVSLQYKF